MSDNVVKAGIEDVLSSVKRLVSEDSRDKTVSDQTTKARKPGRLVLTDALRISTPDQLGVIPAKAVSEPEVSDAAKPMLLRTCDIVQTGQPANADQDKPETAETKHAPSDDATNSLSAKIEALEAAIAQTEDQWEPDGDSQDAYSGTPSHALPWDVEEEFAAAMSIDAAGGDEPEAVQQAEDASCQAEFIRSSQAVVSDADAEEPGSDENVRTIDMDEDALRTLIAEVVRAELQGTMGERITRNVRKMVRREIARALAAQDLE
ncbi:hypothetical protein [Ruegeria sp. HKCCSP351]|uniref:hypothetical protein n=1 Tax=Ruegeria sp. HKCCSP351 TaxID=2794832 RepID=UPI001AE7F764|nr:hypothetical protein [Ruegeria sp. HKCCSP351]